MLVEQLFEPYGAPKQVHSDEDVRIRSDTGWYKRVLNALNVEVMKPVRTPVAILGSLGVCIYVPASRHWLISYSPIHLI